MTIDIGWEIMLEEDGSVTLKFIDIGAFGKVEHLVHFKVFQDTWREYEDGATVTRRIEVPEDNFAITSGGLIIYQYVQGVGTWYGSERTRRDYEEVDAKRTPEEKKRR